MPWAIRKAGTVYPVTFDHIEYLSARDARNVADVMATQENQSYEVYEYDWAVGPTTPLRLAEVLLVPPGKPWCMR